MVQIRTPTTQLLPVEVLFHFHFVLMLMFCFVFFSFPVFVVTSYLVSEKKLYTPAFIFTAAPRT